LFLYNTDFQYFENFSTLKFAAKLQKKRKKKKIVEAKKKNSIFASSKTETFKA
jgi:hypothetical protein